MWTLYILKCEDDSFYTGITQDMARRFHDHVNRQGGHYTKYCQSEEVVYTEAFESESEAKQREQQIKRWSRAKKQALIDDNVVELQRLSVSRD